MKILTNGKFKKKKPTYYGRAKCKKCKCEFIFEYEDTKEIISPKLETIYFYIRCPECHKSIEMGGVINGTFLPCSCEILELN